MNFDKSIDGLLSGKIFSSGFRIKIGKNEKQIEYRQEYLETLVKGKKVIHFGCVDHLPVISEKIKNNTWLHKRLCEKASECLGVDINQEGIDYIAKLGYPDSLCLDVINDEVPSRVMNTKWDFILLGETLEHIDNPVLFLEAIKNKYKGYVNEIIITVPSALRLNNFRDSLKNIEANNSDHRYWFSPYTLAKVLTISGYTISYFQMCNNYYPKSTSLITRFLLRRFPALRETVVMVAKF